ncbi:MAG: hypothetical protein ACKVP0_21610 [Pirellulaceae bacterium]
MQPTAIAAASSSFLDTAWKGAAAVAAPLFGAMLLDLADLLSLGPQALPLAVLVAAPLGWAVAAALGFKRNGRLISASVAGIYCLLPGMELIPAATATSLLGVLSARLSPRPLVA